MSPTLRVFALLGAALGAFVAVRVLARQAPRLLGHRSTTAVAVLVAASAVAAALGPGEPTGLAGVDAAYRAAFGALVALFAARARRNAWLTAAGLAAVGAHPTGWGVVGFGLLGVAVGASIGRRWARPAAALWGAALAQVLLRLTWPEPVGLTALAAAIAVAVLGVSWYRQAPRAQRHRARQLAAGTAAVTAGLLLLAVAAGLSARAGLTRGVDAADAGLAAARDGELTDAAERFAQAATALGDAHGDLAVGWVQPTRALPVLGRYLADAEALTDAGAEVAHRAGRVAERSSEQLRVVDGGIDLAALGELRGELARSIDALAAAETTMRNPSAADWTPAPLQDRYIRLAGRLRDGVADARVLLQAVDLAPGFLGQGGDRRWFLAVFTPVEHRYGGGVIGNYGELVTEAGRLRLDRFGRIGELTSLQETREVTLTPELTEGLARYGEVGVATFLQNALQTPDFSLSAAAMEQLYPQLDGAPVSGTVALDPTGLAALLEVTGPVSVPSWPEPISAANAEQVLYFEQYLVFEADDAGTGQDRVDFLGEVARAVVGRLTSGDLGSPSTLVRALATAVDGGHVLFHSAVPEEQAFIESVGAGGTVAPPPGGDYLRVGTHNAAPSKIDWFLQRSVRYAPTFDPDTGEVTATLEVELRNDAPPDGLPAYIIGGGAEDEGFPPPGHTRLWVTFYSPLDVVRATIDGQPLTLNSTRELGLNAHAAVIDVPPRSAVTIRTDLRGTLFRNPTYRLRVGVQPQVRPDLLEVDLAPADGWDAGGEAHVSGPQEAEVAMAVPLRER